MGLHRELHAGGPVMPDDREDVRRVATVIGLKEDHAKEYKRLHAAVWPDVLHRIAKSNIRNYSIHLRRLDDGRLYLFSYFEYVGHDYDADMARMAEDPATQRWWDVCKPCQQPLERVGENEWWSDMEEVFYFPG